MDEQHCIKQFENDVLFIYTAGAKQQILIRVKAKNKIGYGWPTETLEANTFEAGN